MDTTALVPLRILGLRVWRCGAAPGQTQSRARRVKWNGGGRWPCLIDTKQFRHLLGLIRHGPSRSVFGSGRMAATCIGTDPAAMGILRRTTLNVVRAIQQDSGPDVSIGLLQNQIGHRPWILA